MGLYETIAGRTPNQIRAALGGPDSKYYAYGYGTGPSFYDKLSSGHGSGFGEMTRAQRQAQALAGYASGEQSAARDLSADQMARQKLAFQSAAATAERGGYNPSARREAAFSQAQAAQDTAGQSAIAEDMERRRAAGLYAGAAGQVLQGQLGAQALDQGYAGQNIHDKQALWGARAQSDANRLDLVRMREAYRDAENARHRNIIMGGIQAGSSVFGSAVSAFGKGMKK